MGYITIKANHINLHSDFDIFNTGFLYNMNIR